MKLTHFVTIITCFVGAINASEIFKRTNCISNGGEICGNWNSLCCNNVSVELPDAYDCWILWPFIKSKIRVCGDGKKPKKEENTCACKPTPTLSAATTASIDATSAATPLKDGQDNATPSESKASSPSETVPPIANTDSKSNNKK
ncbi:hypothetical protein H8356DRAFT_1737793 [Neocallimastix lanati (nom. inval.)]|uniref:CBM1 domain-containing protein n=1 Tax=Neocallimastix californiae TaxID=1754190 RepID=A0A1Y2AZU2_9FUNG|nr:hypothetical protein H8356DRAFT_1737793 [Neocallimastix sp. JGI-2020a]ORY28082.1 hypothetical protein LY90DRAFT_705762 [Neocallimastix californiae]|eukprot:ORY28082.1 hypothetical protein LY90DRAFT_705762 [Neocallimastix californiae]